MLRTPLLPLETFAAWQAAADPRRYLAQLVDEPEVREALFLASPSLCESIGRWQRDPDSPAGREVELALARYLARMAGRSTPFGLFAAVSAGQLGSATALELAARRDYRRRTRIDNDYLFALVDAIGRQPEARARLRYRPNDSLYEVNGRLRFAEARLAGKERSYHLVAVDKSPYLAATLERCRHGARLADLAAALVDAEVTLAEAAAYIDELVDAQVLVPELGIAVTGPEPIDLLVGKLQAAGLDNPAHVLATAREALAALDRRVGNDVAAYQVVAGSLEQLPAKLELARLFQVDMVKPASAVLATRVAADVARALDWLRAIQRPQRETSLDQFRTAFASRYENRQVPLTEVLDEEAGIGFEAASGPGSEGAPLLADLAFPARPGAEQAAWGAFERHMQRRLVSAVAAGDLEIELRDTDQRAMSSGTPSPLPDAFDALIRLEQAPDGAMTILLESASGPSGARMLGRFCHASADIDAIVRAHLRAEEAHRPDAIFAEVVHLNEGRIGNVVCRPVLRDHEIVFLGTSGAPAERQITVDDLLVSVVGERIVLTSRRLGREVIPRLTTAHNYRLRSLGMYRFLCALQGARGFGWSWGVLGGAPFLPRVRIGNVIVARATWNLDAEDLEPLTRIVREMACKQAQALPATERRARIAEEVARLRARRRLPRFVVIAEHDNELPIDFDNPLLVQVFADEVAGSSAVQLVEPFPAPGASPVRAPEGSFANQIILGFVRPAPRSAATAPRAAITAPRSQRSFPPGSSWLYAKLYTGVSTADRVLREAIAPLVRDVMARGDASHWFFIRYADPEPHLRVRFAGDPARLCSHVLPALERAIAPLRADGSIWKVQLDTYEREIERYGGDRGIELCEQLFWVDSEAVLAIVERLEGDAGADARWRLALRGAETLLDVLGFDPDARHHVFADARDSLGREHGVDASFYAPIGERYKRERAALEALFVPDAALDAEHELSPGFELLHRRDERLRPIAAELRRRDGLGELAPALRDIGWSLVHMHVNRLLHASQRAQELVLYDLLRRLHEARRARAKRT